MDRRQRILAAALAIILAGYVADQAYRRVYEQPMAAAEKRVGALEQELHKGSLEARRQQNRLPKLDQLQNRSLPRNIELAVTEYRSWLLKALDDSGLEQANLDSGSPARYRDLYTRVDFSLRTHGTLAQVTQLLHKIYRADYLHKIRSLSLTPTAEGSVDVSMTIETLSVPLVASTDQLPAPNQLASSIAPLDDYRVIARRNLFRPGEPPAASIKLSAVTSGVDQRQQAWLRFLKTGETRILAEGESVTLDGSSMRVVRIHANTVEFEIDGKRKDVRIGHALAEASTEDKKSAADPKSKNGSEGEPLVIGASGRSEF